MSRSNRRRSERERDQRRAQDRLKQAAEQLLDSEGWQRWVRARARNGLARYSVSNLCLIMQANPDATFVAGFKAWLELGYCARKGERAIRIFAPMPVKLDEQRRDQESGQTRLLFRVASVFDRTQVAPLDGADQAPLEPPGEPLTGDSHQHLLEPVRAFARDLGYAVRFDQTPHGVGGWCDRKAKEIVVDSGAPANAQLRTLIHETTPALGVDYERFPRARSEVIVDSVTFIVCPAVGLAIDGESIPYVAGWGETGALKAVTQFAQTIDGLARRIENALQPAIETESAAVPSAPSRTIAV